MELCSNNTNKLSPQEHTSIKDFNINSSNNTNKLSPQEPFFVYNYSIYCSNNTNKLSPQEHPPTATRYAQVQIIQINLVLKNSLLNLFAVVSFK